MQIDLKRDITVGVAAVAVVFMIVSVSNQILISTDFKSYLLGFERWKDAGQFLPGAFGDFGRSLLISEYPGSLIFNIPWLLATAVPESLVVVTYAVTISTCLYVVGVYLGRRLGAHPNSGRIVGAFIPFMLLIPGPIFLNSVGRYDPSFLWQLILTNIMLASFALVRRLATLSLALLSLLGGCFIFFSNIQFFPVSIPVMLFGVGVAISIVKQNYERRRILVSALFMFLPALIASPVFIGTYLFSVWQIPHVAVAENIDVGVNLSQYLNLLLPFPALGAFTTDSRPIRYLIRAIVFAVLLCLILRRKNGERGQLARLSGIAVMLSVSYATVYAVCNVVLHREIGVDPAYTQIFAYPLWILLITDSVLNLTYGHVGRGLATRMLLPLLLVSLWGTQWLVRNIDTRQQAQEVPVRPSTTSLRLDRLTQSDQASGLLSRVIILQSRFPQDRQGNGQRIRRSSDFSETFLFELSALRVPVLNAYSHMISPITFSMTNSLFGDGRPSWRQFSLYDRANLAAMPSLGIKYILSEEPIYDGRLELLSSEPFLAHGIYPTDSKAFLYVLKNMADLHNRSIRYEISGSKLRIVGVVDPSNPLQIPLEFSYCITINGATRASELRIDRNDSGLIRLWGKGTIDATIEYNNSIFQFQNCRIRDFLSSRGRMNLSP